MSGIGTDPQKSATSFGGVRLNRTPTTYKPETEKALINAQLLNKLMDRLLSQAFFAFLLVAIVVIYGFKYASDLKEFKDSMEVFKILTPIVTLYLGFAIGQKVNG